MSILEWLFEAQIQFGSKSITYREIIGGLLGLTSAVFGLKRKVFAWPIGITGDALLFTVFLGAVFSFGADGDEKSVIKTGQLVTYRDGDQIVITADLNQESRSPTMDVLILGGLPIKEPVAWMGPFVMNTKTEVLKAFDDFQKGVLGVVPPDWSKAKRPMQRDGIGYKLSGDLKGVHGTPEELQER